MAARISNRPTRKPAHNIVLKRLEPFIPKRCFAGIQKYTKDKRVSIKALFAMNTLANTSGLNFEISLKRIL